MALNRRSGKHDIWVSGISGLLAGEDFCQYRPWVFARFWPPRSSKEEFDKDTWIVKHSEMVKARAAVLRADGWHVTIEGENSFTVHGKTVNLSGKPDIIATRGDDVLIDDEKGGQVRLAHAWQVRVYQYALSRPSVRPDLVGKRFIGGVDYGESYERIGPLEPEQHARIVQLIRELGMDLKPNPTPSERECQYCKVPLDVCPDRGGAKAVGETDDF